MSSGMSTLVRFGDFELDWETRSLSRAGQPISLSPRTFDLLAYLVQNPQRLVTREELLNALWPDSYVEESNLSQHIFLLRKALHESRETARLVRTIPGQGYEFMARVEALDIPEPAPLPQPDFQVHAAHSITRVVVEETEEDGSSRLRSRMAKLTAVLLGLGAVVASAIAGVVAWRSAHTPPVSLAVLPLVNRTGDPGQDYVCDGLADELIDELDRVPVRKLRVVAPDAEHIDAGKPVDAIGRQLGVQYVLEGTLRQQGAYVRVSAHLVRVADQTTIWSNVYDGDPSNESAFESGITAAVEHALSLHLSPLAPVAYRPEKYEAHDAYLKGLYYFSQRNREGFERAIESFSHAVAIDPKYAAAYAQLASTYNLLGQYGWMDRESARSLGWAAASQALSLDPNQAEAHAALGFSRWFYQWDLAGSEDEFREAIALDPANIDAHHWYAQMLMAAGRFAEAQQQMQAALDIDPVSPILRTNLGWLSYFEGNFPQAIAQVQDVLSENPEFLSAHYKLWYAYSAIGDREHAAQEFPWIVHSIADPARERAILGALKSGGYDAGLRAIAVNEGSDGNGSSVEGARCLITAGDRQGALALLENAYHDHEGWILFLPYDPTFASLHNDPRFQAIVQGIGKGK